MQNPRSRSSRVSPQIHSQDLTYDFIENLLQQLVFVLDVVIEGHGSDTARIGEPLPLPMMCEWSIVATQLRFSLGTMKQPG